MRVFNAFRRARTRLAGIELVHNIRKGQLKYPTGVRLSQAEQFYLLAAKDIGSATFTDWPTLMRQSQRVLL